MSTTQLVWGKAGSNAYGPTVPVFTSPGAVSELITPTAQSTLSANSAAQVTRSFCRVTTDASAVYVKFGPASGLTSLTDPSVGAGTGGRFMVPSNWSEIFEVNAGDSAAVSLASQWGNEPGYSAIAVTSGVPFTACRAINAAAALTATSVTFADGSIVNNYPLQIGYNSISIISITGTWSSGNVVAIY